MTLCYQESAYTEDGFGSVAAHAEGSRFNLQYSKRKEVRERGKEEEGKGEEGGGEKERVEPWSIILTQEPASKVQGRRELKEKQRGESQ